MSFSKEEISVIRETWEPIKSCPTKWPRLFIILFTEDPEIKKQFKSFENIPNDQLISNKGLKAHAANVVSLLSGFVMVLNDEETLVQMIKNMAQRHYERKNPIPMFETLGGVLIKWLKETEGDKINDEAVAAWTKLYAALVSTVKAKYSELDKSS